MSQFREIAATTADPEMLKNLSTSKEAGIRYEVASNKNTPQEILQKLSHDPVESVASAAKNNLGGVEAPSSQEAFQQRQELHPQGTQGSYEYLEKLQNRSSTFLTLAFVTLGAGILLLLVAFGAASSSYGGFLEGPAAISLMLSIGLLQTAFFFAVAYIFTSTMAQHAAVNYHLAQEK